MPYSFAFICILSTKSYGSYMNVSTSKNLWRLKFGGRGIGSWISLYVIISR